jgi:hypothetical protein
MGLSVDFLESLNPGVSIHLGGGQRGVAQQLLDRPEIGAGVHQVSGEGVAEGVNPLP